MWSFLGSLKMEFASPIDVSEFHDPYITFYWNSDDNIGSFQLSISQGEAIGGSTFSPGKTDKTYDPDAKYDLYTLRPTNKQWHCITARLKDLTVVITSLTVHFFFLSINPFLRFLLIYTTVKNPSIHAAIICNANKIIVSTDALVFLFTAWLIPVKNPQMAAAIPTPATMFSSVEIIV